MHSRQAFIAHVRKYDQATQPLSKHLEQVALLTEQFASKISLPTAGKILGLLHDIGKYSQSFQNYIRGASGLKGEEAKIAAEKYRRKIDHSTSGAQILWNFIEKKNCDGLHCAIAQTLSSCIAAHHSTRGLLDFVAHDGTSPFIQRIEKPEHKTFINEVKKNSEILFEEHLSFESLAQEFSPLYKRIQQDPCSRLIKIFHHGLLVRYLFSCLIDADRLDTANFETAHLPSPRLGPINWPKLVSTFEQYLENLQSKSSIDRIRTSVSQSCFNAAKQPRGTFSLTVPTGGGKTLASLRFGLHHAMQHKMDRIIYVVPYTSIIDQNAQCVRDILGEKNVLEHHSNLLPERDNWRNRVLTANWDAPIIFTTMVQFLDTLFSAPTSDIRRMHQMANSLIIFDEIQTLPIKTVHLFNNAMNFLVQYCESTLVLCTATQPLLHKVDAKRGALQLNEQNKIIADENHLFQKLKRNIIKDYRKPKGWVTSEVSQLAKTVVEEKNSVLIIVNTKASALELYKELSQSLNSKIYHLSTSMCPAHRKKIIQSIKEDLKQNAKIICVSTQLIEAGVDLDFGSVIRYLAGLDSIAQAAGRCNRHGYQNSPGPVYVINPSQENLKSLPEILQAQEITQRILDDFKEYPASLDHNLLSPKAIARFFEGSFTRRSDEMVYPWNKHCNTNLLDLLSENKIYKKNYHDTHLFYHQAFSEASMAFQVIDTPTQGIIVPYGNEGKTLIAELASSWSSPNFPLKRQYELLRIAQQYSVNIFSNDFEQLSKEGALYEIQNDSGLLYLDERYYSEDYGVSLLQNSLMSFISI